MNSPDWGDLFQQDNAREHDKSVDFAAKFLKSQFNHAVGVCVSKGQSCLSGGPTQY